MPEFIIRKLSKRENDFILYFRRFTEDNPDLTLDEARLIMLQTLVRELALAESLLADSDLIFFMEQSAGLVSGNA